MKTILHPDYWVEVPEGEYTTGITPAQREYLQQLFRWENDYAARPLLQRNMLDDALENLRNGKSISDRYVETFAKFDPPVLGILAALFSFDRKVVYLKRFYMARFPVTATQYHEFLHGTSPKNLNGMLDEPEFYEFRAGFFRRKKRRVYPRCAAQVQPEQAIAFCNQLGARLPTSLEWEKAARGYVGNLYPWGDEWDINAGFFYYGQERENTGFGGKPPIDACPKNVSPYGVWGMAGGIPELVSASAIGSSVNYHFSGERTVWEYRGEGLRVEIRGCYPRHSSARTAYRDHLLAQSGYDEFPTPRSLRLVIDELP